MASKIYFMSDAHIGNGDMIDNLKLYTRDPSKEISLLWDKIADQKKVSSDPNDMVLTYSVGKFGKGLRIEEKKERPVIPEISKTIRDGIIPFSKLT